MFKFVAFFALLAVAAAAPGLITETHHVVQPVVTKTAYVDNSASSAITHQSFTNLERKVPVVHTVAAAPVVKTVSTPVVHTYAAAAPLVKTVAAPVVHTYAAAPVLKTVATPVVHTYAAAPVVHTAPLVKTVVAAPVAYTAFH
ncbi:cuticle protein LPCP-23-like [Musca vetustissima]|uniref:cuticle protein LPCP-23-like n=1 Tax=Musca vetustissima TaxID=27455 RepID=UPI002AB61FE1|nr:cuticle protein LPCP-23-like [Musca vetustissima]